MSSFTDMDSHFNGFQFSVLLMFWPRSQFCHSVLRSTEIYLLNVIDKYRLGIEWGPDFLRIQCGHLCGVRSILK